MSITQEKIIATNLTGWDATAFSDKDNNTAALQRIVNNGFNTVFIGFQWAFDSVTGENVTDRLNPWGGNPNANMADIEALAIQAKELGLNVIFRPHAALHDQSTSYTTGNIGSISRLESYPNLSIDGFFNAHKDRIVDLAKLAEKLGHQTMSIGAEMNAFDTSAYNDHWYNLIADVREVFGGKLSYSAGAWLNGQPDIRDVSFFDRLDYVGVSFYPYLGEAGGVTDYEEIYNSWYSAQTPIGNVNYIEFLKGLSQKFNKPILIEETGFNSIYDAENTGFVNTFDIEADFQVDFDTQALAIESLFRVLLPENQNEWLAGLSLWGVTPSLWGAWLETTKKINPWLYERYSYDGAYTGKPSEIVINSILNGRNYLEVNQKIFEGTGDSDRIALYGIVGSDNPSALLDTNLVRAQTFKTNISVTLGGTVVDGYSPTVGFYLNQNKLGSKQLSTNIIGTPDSNGLSWSKVETVKFSLDNIQKIDELKISIDSSPILQNGINKSNIWISSVDINGVILDSAIYEQSSGSKATFEIPNGSLWNGGHITLDSNFYNAALAMQPGSASSPITVNAGDGDDTVYALGKLINYSFKANEEGQWLLIDKSGYSQNAILNDVEQVSFQDGSHIFLPALLTAEARNATYYQTQSTLVAALPYDGPVDFLKFQMFGSDDSDIITGADSNDFMNLLGGDDAANGGDGQDVLDGGLGSNFLTGGGGPDTFFLDGRSGINTWSTITDFANEDNVNIWGWVNDTSKLILALDDQGADGFKGATFHYDLDGNGMIDTSITFSNLALASIPSPTAEEIVGNGYLLFA